MANLTDKRGRTWEMFTDRSNFDMICVRCTSDRSFNSPLSFHFALRADAEQFLELVLRAH